MDPLGMAASTGTLAPSNDGTTSATFGSSLERTAGSGANNLFAQALAAASSASGGTGSPSSLATSLASGGSSGTGSASTSSADLVSLLLSVESAGGSVPSTAATAPASATGGPSGSAVVAEADKFLGTPYVWGGSAPGGFDCSGLVQYVYAQLGVSLPRTSEEQATLGTAVPGMAEAQPGDLLFFAGSDGTASAPGHVGIYIGNGQMIDAPYTGTDVRIESVPVDQVVDVRRVLPAPEAASSAGPAPVPGAGGSVTMGNVSVPSVYAGTIEQAAAANGIPPSLLAALVKHESEFEPTVVSSAGAEGIAQFMPTTAAGMGVDPFDPTSAINGAAQLLGRYTVQFGSYADALAAYDAGPSAVIRYGGIPPYAETQAYVPAVLAMAGLTGASPAVA